MRASILIAVLAATLVAAPLASAAAIEITTPGKKAPLHCSASKRTVSIDAAEVTVTITGSCRSITVSGAGVHVKASTVDKISISGSNSRVSYLHSSTGGRAKTDVSGTGSKIVRR